MIKKILVLLFILIALTEVRANGIQVASVTEIVSGADRYLSFSLQWENSWRMSAAPFNWDAAWIFVKRRECAGARWTHVSLSPSSAAHSSQAPLTVTAYADKIGVMVYRGADGSGSIAANTIQLKLDNPPAGNYEYKVCAIEMVYVPEGAFYLGDGVSPQAFQVGNTNNPYQVTSNDAINIGYYPPDLWANEFNIIGNFTLPAAYPKGFNAFYCMKYEISQGQYADFLNSLTQDQFAVRYDAAKYNQNRYTITGSWPLLSAAAPDRACNWMSVEDLCAYLDWSGLSPMSEMEFEKSARGPMSPVLGEYAWGGNQVTDANSITPGTDGLPNESVTDVVATGTGLANYNNDSILGPLRSGFAAKAGTTRFQAGASYYGIMELSGNIYENCVNIDTTNYGRGFRFDGSHGDGELTVAPTPGCANQGWPGSTPGDLVTQISSYASRGGCWASEFGGSPLRVSDRNGNFLQSNYPVSDGNGRSAGFGGRGVSRR